MQPPDPVEAWTSDPFGADIREGYLYARAAADDKGEQLSRVCAVEAWQEVQERPPVLWGSGETVVIVAAVVAIW